MRGNSKKPQKRAEKNKASHAGVRKTGRHIKMKKFADFEYDESEERIFKTRVVNISKTSRMSSTALKKKKLEVVHSSRKKRTARTTRTTSKHETQESQKRVDISKTKAKASRQDTEISSTKDTDDTSKAVAKTDQNSSDEKGKIEDGKDEVAVEAGDLKNESPRSVDAAPSRVKRNLKRKKNLKKGKNNTDKTDQVFNCNVCDEVVVGKDNFNKHKKSHKQTKKVFHCLFEGCTKEFRDSSNLRKHENSVHLNIRKFLCEFCVAQFKTSSCLKTHITAYHTRKEDREQFTCNVCNKSFLRKVSLTQHASLHTDIKNHICSYEGCGKSFRLKETLTKHISAVHKDEKPYECKICWEKFSRRTYLETHMYKHTGIKKFSCEVCGKYFSQKGNLKVHMLLHNKERPVYKCPECSQTFNFKSNLTKHQQTKHLLNDLKIEPGESVEVQNMYTGTKNFGCEVCGKYFSQKSYLKVHMYNKHSKERPVYNCPQCFQTFSTKWNLIKHQQTKHQVNIGKIEAKEAGEGSSTSTAMEKNMNKATDTIKIQQGQSSDRDAYKAIDLSNKRKKSETDKEMEGIKAPCKILVTSGMERNKKSILIVVKHFNDFCEEPLEETNAESENVVKGENEVKSSPVVLVRTQPSSKDLVTESNEIVNHVTFVEETQLNNESEISFQEEKSENEKSESENSALHDSEPKAEVAPRNNDVMAQKSVLSILPEEFLSSGSAADSVAKKIEDNPTPGRKVNCTLSEGKEDIVNDEAGVDGSNRKADGNLQNSEVMPSGSVVYKESSYLTTLQPVVADDKASNFHWREKEAKQDSDLDIKMDTSGVSDSNKSIKVQTLKNPEYFDINELIIKEQVGSEIPVENF